MSEELRETVEILKIGSDYALKITGYNLKQLQKIFALLWSKKNDLPGKKDHLKFMLKCMKEGTQTTIMNFPSEDKSILDEAEKQLKAHGVQFARLPDTKYGDFATQYIVPSEHAFYFNRIAEDLYKGELERISNNNLSSEEKRMTSGLCTPVTEKDIDELCPDGIAKEYKAAGFETNDFQTHASIENSKDTQKKMKNAVRRSELEANSGYEIKSIDKDALLISRDNDSFTFAVPGSKKQEFATIKGHDITEETDKSISFGINRKAAIEIKDKSGNTLKHVNGNDFIKRFNNSVFTNRSKIKGTTKNIKKSANLQKQR